MISEAKLNKDQKKLLRELADLMRLNNNGSVTVTVHDLPKKIYNALPWKTYKSSPYVWKTLHFPGISSASKVSVFPK